MKKKAIIIILFFVLALKVRASETDLVISEIMYDASGSDTNHEWVEIYNSGVEDLTPSSTWRFFDGSNHSLNLEQGDSLISSGEFFILADSAADFLLDYPSYSGTLFDTVMDLPNSSSTISLSFDSGASHPIISAYNSSWGATGNGFSLEKVNDIWQESCNIGGSPGLANLECVVEEIANNYWSQIVISEFMPNPEGSDEAEWIELYNSGPEPVNLAGFALSDNTNNIFIIGSDDFSDLVLEAGEYLLVYKSVSNISLNNSSGDVVKLYSPDGILMESVSYSVSAPEGQSYARENNSFYFTKTPSPGQANQISRNQKPVAQIKVESASFYPKDKINFSASNSYDPENDDLDFFWNFGDGADSSKEEIKHSYQNYGTYQVVLRVTDTEGAYDEATYSLVINLAKAEEEKISDKKAEEKSPEQTKNLVDIETEDLIISEFIPNPEGSDDAEWIELYNNSNKQINLFGWQVDDSEGASKPHTFSTSTIEANGFLLLNKKDTKLSLNNSSDSVRILTPNGELWQEVKYEKIPEGKSYAWDRENQEWFINNPSPGQANLITKEPEIIYAIYEARDSNVEGSVILQGLVLNKLNKNTRSLYLADFVSNSADLSQIIEVYSYYKNFPDLEIGDLVTVSGEISKTADLPRLKIKTAEQIVVSGVNVVFEKPEIIMVDNMDQDFIGQFVTVKGMVVKKSGKNIYMAGALEDEAQLRVYADFPLGDVEIKKGLEIIASGILTSTDSGFKLLPFSLADISVSQEVLGDKISNQDLNIDLVSSTNEVSSGTRKIKVKNILLFSLMALLLVGLSYFARRKYKG